MINEIGELLLNLLVFPFVFLESIIPVGGFLNISGFNGNSIGVYQSILLYILSGSFGIIFLILLFSILNTPINYSKEEGNFEGITILGIFGKILTGKITSVMFLDLLGPNLPKIFLRVTIFVFSLVILYFPFNINGTSVNTLKDFHQIKTEDITTSLNLIKFNFIKTTNVGLQENSPLILEDCEISKDKKTCLEENNIKKNVYYKVYGDLKLLLTKSNSGLVEILPKYKEILEKNKENSSLTKDIEEIKKILYSGTGNISIINKYYLPKLNKGEKQYSEKEKIKINEVLNSLEKNNIQNKMIYYQELSIINNVLLKKQQNIKKDIKELLQIESDNFVKKYNKNLDKQKMIWDDMKKMYQGKMKCEGTKKIEGVFEKKGAIDLLFGKNPCVSSYDKFLFLLWYLFHSFLFLLMLSMMGFRALFLIFISLYTNFILKTKGIEDIPEVIFPNSVDGLKEEFEIFNKDVGRYMIFLIFEILIKVILTLYLFNGIFWN